MDRIWKICSDFELIHIEIFKIKQILINNEYPSHIIDDEIKKFIDKRMINNCTNKLPTDESVKIIYLVLPYLNSKVENFGIDLKNLIKKYYDKVKLKAVFETANDIGRCFPFKEKHERRMESCVIYHLKCSQIVMLIT